MEIGNKVKVMHNTFEQPHIGTVVEIEICYFSIIMENGIKNMYHWNDVEFEILELN